MAFNSASKDFGKEHFYYVEIDVDSCSNTYGSLPCEASGDTATKCFNTLKTCRDPDTNNITTVTKTYGFCSSISPLPKSLPINDGLSTIPNVLGVSLSPSVIDVKGGLGVRASATISFADHPHSNIGIDNYIGERNYIASDQGTFWGKFTAINPFYRFKNIRISTGYIVNNTFDITNFITHHYVIDSLTRKNEQCSIVAKDVLKLADDKESKAPKPSVGVLQSDINTTATSFDIIPNAEYSIGDYIRIGAEVIKVEDIIGNTFSVTRAGGHDYQSTLEEHSQDDVAQLCLEYSGSTVNVIAKDLLVNYANVNSSFINDALWAAEITNNAPTGLSTLITEPVGVSKLLKELSESAACYFHWDSASQQINLTNIKQPPFFDGNPLTESANLLADSVSVKDDPNMRVSTVFVRYGQIDPTKKLDEGNNYAITYVREDTDSVDNYGSRRVQDIYSRWITQNSSIAAINLAARYGRRFSSVPRKINFNLDVKDSELITGKTTFIETSEISDEYGNKSPTAFQIISTAYMKSVYKYTGLEYNYGNSLAQDNAAENPDIYDLLISNNRQGEYVIDAVFAQEYPTITLDNTKTVRVIIDTNVIVGCNSTALSAIKTGTNFNGATVLIENRSFIVGAGDDSATRSGGGAAIIMNHPITLNNLGVIGGGGGAGGDAYGLVELDPGIQEEVNASIGGGGGAGYVAGSAGIASSESIEEPISLNASLAGALEVGGSGGSSLLIAGKNVFSGAGGDLGQAGQAAGGTALDSALPPTAGGNAIELNGFAITYINVGDIRGAVI